MDAIERIQNLIQYRYKDSHLLWQALTHTSYGHEHLISLPISLRDNERLEFLGDAILDAVISDMLQEAYPEANEGKLSKMRAAAVNEKTLHQIALTLELDQWLRLGKGESQSKGNKKPSILSSTFEALIASIYLDGGFSPAYEVIQRLFQPLIENSKLFVQSIDYKTLLQEKIQGKFKITPSYHLIDATGPDHAKIFSVEVKMNDTALAQAQGTSKKEAEQKAAQEAIQHIEAMKP